jgi:hypothetical protein
MLHFAYGSNMDRAVMRRHAPHAVAMGVAVLADHRFIITADGYASVEPKRASLVYGVLWRLTPRDRVILDRWECTADGQYRAETLPVKTVQAIGGGRRRAMVYIARPRAHGRPKPGYMKLVLAAAQGWHLPAGYLASLETWFARPLGAGTRDLKEFASP